MQLVKYDAARKALQEANSVDEVKGIRDKAEAMRAYAKQSKDFDMANWAAEIRIRAERKLGGMLQAQKKDGGMNKGAATPSHDDSALIPKLSDMGISHSMSSRAQAIASVPETEFENTIAEHREQQKELTSATIHKLLDKAHVSHNSGEHEWYTPECFIDSARKVMGSIDLDPATSKKAQETVKAIRYFTAEENGLLPDNEWFGNIWMNPPYQGGLIDKFIAKLHLADDVTNAIVLVNNATDTAWFSMLAEKAAAICFPKGRIKFNDKNGNPGAPLQGQAIVYRGDRPNSFCDEFMQYGFCVLNVR